MIVCALRSIDPGLGDPNIRDARSVDIATTHLHIQIQSESFILCTALHCKEHRIVVHNYLRLRAGLLI